LRNRRGEEEIFEQLEGLYDFAKKSGVEDAFYLLLLDEEYAFGGAINLHS
jgi:hypothetical protein